MSLFNAPSNLLDAAEAIVDEVSGDIGSSLSSFTGGLFDPDAFDDILDSVTDSIAGGDLTSVAEQLSQFTEYPADILENLLRESGFLQNISFGNIGTLIANFVNDLEDYSTFIINYTNDLFEEFSGGLVGYLENIVAQSSGGAQQVLQGIADTTIPKEDVDKILKDLQEDNVDAAAETLSKYSEQPISVLRVLLQQLDATIAGTLVVNSTVGIFPPSYEIGTNLYQWSGQDTDEQTFTYVSSVQELDAEVRSIQREITELVIHWTETFTNANLTAGQIHDTHVALGHEGIGYHYIIRRDGSLQRGRPVDLEGEHCNVNGHNQRSVAIAFVGGLNTATADSLVDEYSSAASLTRQQFNTFNRVLKAFYLHYPGIQVLGHNDIEPDQPDPGFDVIEYCFNRFNKVTLFASPSEQPPFTTQQINDYLTQERVDGENVFTDWVIY